MDNPLQQFLQQPKSVIDYQTDYARADALRNQNALQSLTLQQQQAATAQSLGERNALQRIAAQSGGDRTALISGLRNSGLPGLMTQADSLEKSGADLQTAQSVAAKNTADAAKTNQGVQQTNYTQAMQKVLAFQSPADALASLNSAVGSGKIDMAHATMMARSIPQNDPTAFDAWKRQWAIGIADPEKMAELMKPHLQTTNTGGQQVTQAIDPVTLKPTTVSTLTNTQSPDNAATQAGENARAAAQRETQLTIAGMSKDGSLSPNLEAEAQLIAAGRAAPPTGMAATRPAAAALMARVSQINPQFDATDYLAKTKAAKDFTSGNQGNAMRSFAVAGQHLDQLGQLVDALHNGDNQTINKVGNVISAWNGNTPVTNFDAAKDVVSKEVIKAIVGSGAGGVDERRELAQLMADAKSPQQLHGIIKQYTSLMSAQHDALLAQRRAAGLKDSTLPNYGDAVNGAGSAPTGWKYLGPAPTGSQ